MIKRIIGFFTKRKEQSRLMRYRQGFDYAAGEMLNDNSVGTYVRLDKQIETAKEFNEADDFEKGMEDALSFYDYE